MNSVNEICRDEMTDWMWHMVSNETMTGETGNWRWRRLLVKLFGCCFLAVPETVFKIRVPTISAKRTTDIPGKYRNSWETRQKTLKIVSASGCAKIKIATRLTQARLQGRNSLKLRCLREFGVVVNMMPDGHCGNPLPPSRKQSFSSDFVESAQSRSPQVSLKMFKIAGRRRVKSSRRHWPHLLSFHTMMVSWLKRSGRAVPVGQSVGKAVKLARGNTGGFLVLSHL